MSWHAYLSFLFYSHACLEILGILFKKTKNASHIISATTVSTYPLRQKKKINWAFVSSVECKIQLWHQSYSTFFFKCSFHIININHVVSRHWRFLFSEVYHQRFLHHISRLPLLRRVSEKKRCIRKATFWIYFNDNKLLIWLVDWFLRVTNVL